RLPMAPLPTVATCREWRERDCAYIGRLTPDTVAAPAGLDVEEVNRAVAEAVRESPPVGTDGPSHSVCLGRRRVRAAADFAGAGVVDDEILAGASHDAVPRESDCVVHAGASQPNKVRRSAAVEPPLLQIRRAIAAVIQIHRGPEEEAVTAVAGDDHRFRRA